MSLRFRTREEKTKVVEKLRQAIRVTMFNGLSPANQKAVEEHLDWLSQQPDELDIRCSFQTEPHTQQTYVSFAIVPSTKLKVNNARN